MYKFRDYKQTKTDRISKLYSHQKSEGFAARYYTVTHAVFAHHLHAMPA